MFESDVSLESFLAFATDCDLNGQTVKAIIDHDVEIIDSNDEVRSMAYLVTMTKENANFSKSDIITDGIISVRLQDKVQNDGILVGISAV